MSLISQPTARGRVRLYDAETGALVMQECTVCGSVLAVGEFSSSASSPDGIRSMCKDCDNRARTERGRREKPTKRAEPKPEVQPLPPEPFSGRCGDCRYWDPSTGYENGWCHLRGPARGDWKWPRTARTDWCGNAKPRSEAV